MIKIKSKRNGFRRCGIAHTKEPREYPEGAFSAAEIEVLKAESMLTVLVVEEEEPRDTKNFKPEDIMEDELIAELSEHQGFVPVESQGELVAMVEAHREAKANEDRVTVAAAVKRAIDAGQVTKDGKPTLDYLSVLCGRRVGGAERDEILADAKTEEDKDPDGEGTQPPDAEKTDEDGEGGPPETEKTDKSGDGAEPPDAGNDVTDTDGE